MQIAKMFASMGFNVDTSGLEKFRAGIKLARTDIRNMAGDSKVAATQLRSLSAALDGLSTKLDKISIKKANQNIADSYKEVSKSVGLVEKSLTSIQNNQKGITKALGRIHASVKAGEPIWDRYRASVKSVRDELTSVNGKMNQLRSNSTVSLRVNQGVGGSNSQPRQSRDNGFFGNFAGGASGGMMGGFFRSMLPAVALGGGLPAAGFAVKEVVNRGREQQKMENVLMFSSKNLDEFNSSLQYVRKTALDLGTSSVDLGKAFAQVNMSAGDSLTTEQKKKMFTEASSIFAVMGASKDEQGLLYKAVNQMFSLGRIQAEEMNQLTGQGLVPRQAVYDAIRQVYGSKLSNEQIAKMQKANQLDPSKILPKLFENLAKKAETSGAMAKYRESSIYKQGQVIERFNQLSQQIMNSGLDKFLANLFSSLTMLIDHVMYLVEAFKAFKSSLDSVSGGNGLLVAGLILTIKLLMNKRKALALVGKQGMKVTEVFKVLSNFMRGNLNSSFLLIARRILWVTALIEGIAFVFDQVQKKMNGQDNWIDTMIKAFNVLGLIISNRLGLIKLEFQDMIYMMNPLNWGEKRVEVGYFFGGKNRGTEQQWNEKTGKAKPKQQAPKGSLQYSYEQYNKMLNRTPRLNPFGERPHETSMNSRPITNIIKLNDRVIHQSTFTESNNETVNLWGV